MARGCGAGDQNEKRETNTASLDKLPRCPYHGLLFVLAPVIDNQHRGRAGRVKRLALFGKDNRAGMTSTPQKKEKP